MSDTPHRYTAELAGQIEVAWQDRWAERGTYHAPNPAGPWADPDAVAAYPGGHLLVLDMFPYPSGAGLHVGHPLGYIATDVVARFNRMLGKNVLHAWATTRSGCRPSSTPCRPASTRARPPRRTSSSWRASCAAWAWATTTAAPSRPSTRTTTAGRSGSSCRSTTPGTTRMPCAPTAASAAPARSPSSSRSTARGARPLPADDGRGWDDLSDVERAGILDGQRLAYTSEAPVNWCPGLGTVLSNEEVTNDGRSERGNFPVFKRNLRQWMMRITAYADRLADDLDRVDWPEKVRIMQRNWIGRSHGAQVTFPIASGESAGCRSTSTAAAAHRDRGLHHPPRHPLRRDLHGAGPRAPARRRAGPGRRLARRAPRTPGPVAPPRRQEAVDGYRRAASRKTDIERQTEGKDKTGVFTGGWATNPVTGTRIPVFVADYVLMGYGTGAIMAVPGQDERDWDFAKAFDLPIIRTVQPTDGHDESTAFTGAGPGDQLQQRRAEPRRARRRRRQGADHRLAAGEGPRRAHGHLQAARLAVQPAALLGRAVPGGLRRGRRRPRRARLDAAGRAARGARLQPEDLRPRRREQRARAAAVAGRRVGARRPRPRRRPRHPPLPPRDQHDAQLGRVVLVLPALPRPGQPRRARRPRQRGLLDGAARRAGRRRPRRHPRPGRRRPLRRRRRARRAAPALRPLLAQGAARPGPPEQRRAVPHLLQPGLHPGRRLPRRPRPARRGQGGRGGGRRQPRPGTASRSPASSARSASR